MLEIRTDISSLTKRQREMLTGFILTFDLPESPADIAAPYRAETVVEFPDHREGGAAYYTADECTTQPPPADHPHPEHPPQHVRHS